MTETTQQASTGSGEVMRKLPGTIAIIKEAWGIFKEKGALLVGLFVIPTIVSAVIFGGLFAGIISGQVGLGILLFSSFAAMIVIGVLWVTVGITFIHVLARPKGSFSLGGVFKESLSQFWSYIWVNILTAAVVVGGLILFIIPGIIMLIALQFSRFIVLLEGKKGLAALRQSASYVKGYWWAVLGRLLLLVIIIFLPFSIVFGDTSKIPQLSLIGLLHSVISLLLGVFFYICTFLIYRHIADRSAGKPIAAITSTSQNVLIGLSILAGLMLVIILIFAPAFILAFPGSLLQGGRNDDFTAQEYEDMFKQQVLEGQNVSVDFTTSSLPQN